MEIRQSSLDKKKLLVIGGTGFIGSYLVEKGLEFGYEVSVLSLGKKRIERNNISSIICDITSKEDLKKSLSNLKFEYIIHCGGYIDHSQFSMGGIRVINEHLNSLYDLISVIDRSNLKKFLHLGSSDEYGSNPGPQNESLREDPISPYSFAKASATHFLQMLYKTEKFPASIARLFLTYGPGQDEKRFLPQIIKSCLQDLEFDASEGKQFRDFCFVSDTVDGCFKILHSEVSTGEIFNIASGEKISIREMIESVVRIIGKGRPRFGKIPYRIGENLELYADISKAKKLLNFHPQIALEEGLNKTIRYYKNHA